MRQYLDRRNNHIKCTGGHIDPGYPPKQLFKKPKKGDDGLAPGFNPVIYGIMALAWRVPINIGMTKNHDKPIKGVGFKLRPYRHIHNGWTMSHVADKLYFGQV